MQYRPAEGETVRMPACPAYSGTMYFTGRLQGRAPNAEP